MTKKEFIAQVAERAQFTPKEVEKVFDSMVFVLKEQLIAEEKVQLSHLGIFSTVIKQERTITNRFTGAEQVVPQKRVIKYKPSKYLRETVDIRND
ncbi:HU family DNA-binding protein [Mycoplasmopsis gallinacea]|uniref:Viral histone-like protein n=1 Tax=Mycoplasmopsis gallinacea TaxID=29556 RepID=A0A0D5ZK80_9BACT|nr:HU family DNA-binding protein [Mycoplasmopsis gallinacea]AKA50084.1 DNA-binding protein [Mycoplasmopsis gallinacea]QIW62139.1 HU family DNA-binding protein [Mycoplasmopsis gallinacea]